MTFRKLPALLVIVIAALSWANNSLLADTVYNVLPYQLSRGYEVVGGTITTDDTVGNAGTDFFKTNIIGYQIFVTGPINFTFSPSNGGARIFNLDAGVVVTETEIYVESQPSSNYAELRFEAREFLPGNSAPSVQVVYWGQGGAPTPTSRVVFGDSGGPINQGSFNSNPQIDRLLIAVVPILGDVNLDGVVDFLDIGPFIAVLSTGGFQAEADVDENDEVNFLDIGPFIAILTIQ